MWVSTTKLAKIEAVTTQTIRRRIENGFYDKGCYNLAVERFRNDDYKDKGGKFLNMRPAIKAQVEQEQQDAGRAYNSLISDNGTLAAATTFRAVCNKNKKLKGAKSGFSENNNV